MKRCVWCKDDPLYQQYHDEEWGVPLKDPQKLFELLLLEGFQAGLSWITVLRKRQHYRQVLNGFDPLKLAALSDDDIERLMTDPGIIRNRAKLNAVRTNARAWLKLDDPVAFLWSFVNGHSVIHHYSDVTEMPAQSAESEAMSRALKKNGFTFVGPTICYAFMQAAGMVMDHTTDCYRYEPLSSKKKLTL